jgi:hypothetical protein
MAGKTNLSATLFSQKKLLGKTSTGTHRADSNEPIPSGVQVAASTVFAEDVPSSPHTTMFQVQSASNGGAATVEYVEFALEAVTGSTYDANSFDPGAGSQSAGVHAYRLVMTSTYTDNSNNSKKDSYPYKDSQILHWTLGSLQLVGPQFSNDVPNPYNLTVYSGSRDVDDQIPLLDEIDWQIDYYSGILFVQDFDSSKIPTRAKGYIYVGKYLSASLGDLESGGGGSSDTKDVGWFGSNGSISSSGSLYLGTVNTTNPETFFSSVGAATFNEQGRNVDFRIESSNKENAFIVDGGTDQVLILSGGAAKSYNEAGGADVNFYISGSASTRGTNTRGTSVFGGDVVISGSLTTIGSGGGGDVTFNGGNGSDNQMITADGSGGIVAESNITFNGSTLNVTGDILPGTDNTKDLGSPSARWANIYTGDLHLRNERGHWQIIEEREFLTVTNKITGKRYKIVLEPLEEDGFKENDE